MEQAWRILGNVRASLSLIQAIKVQLMEKVDLKKRKKKSWGLKEADEPVPLSRLPGGGSWSL